MMGITTPSDAGDGNGGRYPTTTTQGAIAITQMQDGRGNNLLTLQPHPRPPDGMTAIAVGHAAGMAGGNGVRVGETIENPQLVGYLETFHTGKFSEATVTVAADMAKSNTSAKKWALAAMIRQFLTDGNNNLQDLNRDYYHFTELVSVPETQMTKVTYSHGIVVAGIGQVSPVANKLSELFDNGGEELSLA